LNEGLAVEAVRALDRHEQAAVRALEALVAGATREELARERLLAVRTHDRLPVCGGQLAHAAEASRDIGIGCLDRTGVKERRSRKRIGR
jgi:hypothetical protein